ncbi:hypothetical protein [Gallibacterium anatis]|uniref:hypothetical protein n=1 Tax=Gallibacterium anatis TaxID=750 RepID=UPI000A653DBC|nr:hypothetical protein [Gallibacterium anatis]
MTTQRRITHYSMIFIGILMLAACSSAPKPPEPKGNWYQINSSHYYIDVTQPQKGTK